MSHRSRGPRRDWDYVPQLILTQEPCHRCGKTSYASRGEAKSSIKRLDRDNRKHGHDRSVMHAYECPHGNGWHVAHRLSQGQRTGAAAARTTALAVAS